MRMILEKALIALLNQEKDKADTLFHDFILERSRQIHESLRQGEDFILDESLEGIMSIDEMFGDEDMAEDDVMEDDLEQGDGEEAPAEPEAAGDDLTADDLAGEEGEEGAEDEVEEPIEDRVSDLEADMQRLAAEFDAMMGGDNEELEGEEEQVEEAQISISTTADGEINVIASTDEEEGLDDGMSMDASPIGDDMGADLGADDEFDQFNDLSESIVDELERINVATGDGREQGNGKFKQNTVSPALNTPAEKRLAGSPVKIKSTEHSGYDREAAPTPKKIAQRSNIKATATAGQTPVKKEGDSAALLNKLTADPAGQKSLLGSKK